jgi:arylsulfatase A
MKNLNRSRITFTLAAAVARASLVVALTSAHAQMTTIVEHAFDGSGSALHGVDVVIEGGTFAGGITSAGGSSTWVAAPGFLDNGSVGASREAAYLNLGSYINDAKGTANGKFDLTMTISETSGSWISLGFSTLNTPATNFDFTGAGVIGLGTIIYRLTGELDMFIGPGTGGSKDGPDGNSGPRTLTVRLDLTPAGGFDGVTNFGTVTWTDSGLGAVNNLGTAFALPNQPIGAILFSAANLASGTVSGLTLTQSTGGPDTDPPTLISMVPEADATDVSPDANLVITFDEDVQLGTGNITIKLSSDNSLAETIDVTTPGSVVINGPTVTIVRSMTLALDTTYYVNIDAGAFEDLSGAAYAGLSDTTWAFTTWAGEPLVTENFGEPGNPLNGTDADAFSPIIAAAGGSATWGAGAAFLDNGTVNVDGSQSAAYLNLGTYIDDAAGTADGKFVLTMTVSETVGAWISLGFAVENTPGTGRNFTDTGSGGTTRGMATIIRREIGDWDLDMFPGPALTPPLIDGPEPADPGPRTLIVTLDLTPAGGYDHSTNFGTVTWADSVLGQLGSHTYTSGQRFGSILISEASSSGGTVSALRLTQISGGPDTVAPSLLDTDPANGADNVPAAVSLTAEFSEPVQPGTGDIVILKTAGDVEIDRFDVMSSTQLDFGYRTVTIDPTSNLEAGLEYYVLIEGTAITDLAGNPFPGLTSAGDWAFTIDAVAPTKTSMTPVAAATDVSPDAPLTLVFDEEVRIGSGFIQIRQASDGAVVETIDVTVSDAVLVNGATVTLLRSVSLALDTDYYVTIDAGAFEDLSGNAFSGISDSSSWTFRTLPPLELRVSRNGGLLDFEWFARSGRRYDLVSSTNLANAPSTWAPYDDGTAIYQNIATASAGPTGLNWVVPVGEQRAFALRERRSPNLVVFLADDLGIEALSAYGGVSHATPNVDRLATEGKRFTHCFSNPYCSPSRASLLTGRYPFLHGLKTVLFDQQSQANLYLRTTQPSFARQLKAAGYATAIAGKWQLSFLSQNNTINDFGFDQYQCWQIFDENGNKTRRYYSPHFNRNGVIRDDIADRYGPDVNVEFLIDFMQTQATAGKPFLAYYTSLLPHFPWVPTPDSEDQSYSLPNPESAGDPRYFPDMVSYMDKNLGRLMQAIDDLDIADNTVLVFTADNGTDRSLSNLYENGVTIPGGKGTMTDRGTRVPLIVRWPGRIVAGSTCDDLVDFSDFFPTLCALAAAPLPEDLLHGRSFLPQLIGMPGDPRSWIHVQDQEQRHVRNRDFILNNADELRPTVEIWQPRAATVPKPYSPGEQGAYDALQAVFDALGN